MRRRYSLARVLVDVRGGGRAQRYRCLSLLMTHAVMLWHHVSLGIATAIARRHRRHHRCRRGPQNASRYYNADKMFCLEDRWHIIDVPTANKAPSMRNKWWNHSAFSQFFFLRSEVDNNIYLGRTAILVTRRDALIVAPIMIFFLRRDMVTRRHYCNPIEGRQRDKKWSTWS